MPKKQVIDSHQKHNQKSHGSRSKSGAGSLTAMADLVKAKGTGKQSIKKTSLTAMADKVKARGTGKQSIKKTSLTTMANKVKAKKVRIR